MYLIIDVGGYFYQLGINFLGAEMFQTKTMWVPASSMIR